MSPIPPGCTDGFCSGGGGGGTCSCLAGVQYISVDATIDLDDGVVVVYNGGGLNTITAPPWVLGTVFEVHNDVGSPFPALAEIFMQTPAISPYGFSSEGGVFTFQGPFSIPPGFAYRFTANVQDLWDIEVIHTNRLQGALPSLPFAGQRVTALFAEVTVTGPDASVFPNNVYYHYVDAIWWGVLARGLGWTVIGSDIAITATASLVAESTNTFSDLGSDLDIDILLPGWYEITHQARIGVGSPSDGAEMSSRGPGFSESGVFCAAHYTSSADTLGGTGVATVARHVDITAPGVVEAMYRGGASSDGEFDARSLTIRPIGF